LQEATVALLDATTKSWHANWDSLGIKVLERPIEFDEAFAREDLRFLILLARVHDDAVRRVAKELRSTSVKAQNHAENDTETGEALLSTSTMFKQLNEEIGRVLRQLDALEHAGAPGLASETMESNP
jgi:endonuclease III